MAVQNILMQQWKDGELNTQYPKTLAGNILDANGNFANTNLGNVNAENARQNIGASAKPVIYNVTIPANSWAGSVAPFTVTITVAGILATDTPVITPQYSSTLATAQNQNKAWNNVTYAQTLAGQIQFVAVNKKPATDLSLQVMVIR